MSRPPVNRKLQLQIIFAFIFIYPLLLWLWPGESTAAQAIFRVMAAAVGLVGFVTVSRRTF